VKPFVERRADRPFCSGMIKARPQRFLPRDSHRVLFQGRPPVSNSLSRLLNREIAVGYAAATIRTPSNQYRLKVSSQRTTASITWTATPLDNGQIRIPTPRFRTTLPGLPVLLTHIYKPSQTSNHVFRPLADRDRQFHLGNLDYPGDKPGDTRSTLFRRPDLQAEPQFWFKGT